MVPGAGNPQTFNRYAYVLNSPLNFTDPTGHSICANMPYMCNYIEEKYGAEAVEVVDYGNPGTPGGLTPIVNVKIASGENVTAGEYRQASLIIAEGGSEWDVMFETVTGYGVNEITGPTNIILHDTYWLYRLEDNDTIYTFDPCSALNPGSPEHEACVAQRSQFRGINVDNNVIHVGLDALLENSDNFAHEFAHNFTYVGWNIVESIGLQQAQEDAREFIITEGDYAWGDQSGNDWTYELTADALANLARGYLTGDVEKRVADFVREQVEEALEVTDD